MRVGLSLAGLAAIVAGLAMTLSTALAVPPTPTVSGWPEPEAQACPAGEWPVEGACVTAFDAFAAPGGTTYVVAQRDPRAGDSNPGTAAQPWATIGRAVAALAPGDAVVIREGVYRESIRPRRGGTGAGARITFAAYPGEAVVVTGADRADDGWRRQSDGTWRRGWTGPSLLAYSDDPVFRREMLVADGRVLRPVAARAEVAPGRFWREGTDENPVALVARFPGDRPPSGVEVAHRARLFWPEGPDPSAECGDASTPGWLRVVGITFRHAANRAQWGAVCAGSEGGLFEDVRVEWTVGQGIDASGRGHVFRRTRADLNGQLGWGGGCRGCLFEETAAVGNNWAGHDPFWEAGGGKWAGTTDSVIRRHYAAHNGGPGIWLDIDNARNTIEGCLLVNNEMAGLMLELRTTETLVQHNVIAETRWRAWTGAGVLSQAASRNAYLHNTIVANEGTGLWLRLDPSRRAPDGHNLVAGNWIVGNATAGEEAREIQVEGTDPTHVRTTRFVANAYGRLGAGMERSTFFVYPAPPREPGFRSDDLAAWRQIVGGDAGARLVRPGERVAAVPFGAVTAGAPGTSAQAAAWRGADPTRVRARGDWRGAPPPPARPR